MENVLYDLITMYYLVVLKSNPVVDCGSYSDSFDIVVALIMEVVP